MTRDDFRQQMELYRRAKEQNPQLSYWEWKNNISKFDEGTNREGVQYRRVPGPYLDEIVVTPNGNYVQEPYNERRQQDQYNSQMLDAWGNISQLDILNEAIRPITTFDPVSQIGAIRGTLNGQDYWNTLVGNQRNLGIVPEFLDVNPIVTDIVNLVASAGSGYIPISKINNITKTKLLTNYSQNLRRTNILRRQNFLNSARNEGFEITNALANPRKKKQFEIEFYDPDNEVSISPTENSHVYKYILDYLNNFTDGKHLKFNDYIITKTYPENSRISGTYNHINKIGYINPKYSDNISNTYIHEILSHGTDNILELDQNAKIREFYERLANITKDPTSSRWNEARATLNELRSDIIQNRAAYNIEGISYIPDETLNTIIKNRLPEINRYGQDYMKSFYDLSKIDQDKWLQLFRHGLRSFPIIATPFIVNSLDNYSNGTGEEGIRSTSERPVTVNPYTGEFEYGYNPGAGYLKPVINTRDLLDFTPVGNATTAYDAYNAYDAGNYLGAGLIGAAAVLPGAIAKPAKKLINRVIPTVNPNYVSNKINEVLGKPNKVLANGLDAELYTDVINQRNHIIEDMIEDSDYWDRAAQIYRQYGDDYVDAYSNIMEGYWNNYLGFPEPKLGAQDAMAKMSAKQSAIDRYNRTGEPAGMFDFEYQINPEYGVTYPITRHELSHYVDFNVAKSANADRNNTMFSELKKDLSKDKNPMYPDNTDYFRKGTEQKSYMNTLRQYMLDTGQIKSIGDKVTTDQIKKAINNLPSQYNSVKAAYKQFLSPAKYTKWFNKMPLLGIPGAAIYLNNKETNKSN